MNKAKQKLSKFAKSKKGASVMDSLGDNLAGLFVVGLLAVIFLVILSQLGGLSFVNATVNTTINEMIDAFSDLSSWFTLLILMSVVVIVMASVYLIKAYAGAGGRR